MEFGVKIGTITAVPGTVHVQQCLHLAHGHPIIFPGLTHRVRSLSQTPALHSEQTSPWEHKVALGSNGGCNDK